MRYRACTRRSNKKVHPPSVYKHTEGGWPPRAQHSTSEHEPDESRVGGAEKSVYESGFGIPLIPSATAMHGRASYQPGGERRSSREGGTSLRMPWD